MARSPGHLRLAASATRTLAEKAFEALRQPVVVVDARARSLPVVLANSAARSLLDGVTDEAALIGVSLFGLLGAAAAAQIEALLAAADEAGIGPAHLLGWRLKGEGEVAVLTEIKLLTASGGERLVMLSFARHPPPTEIAAALDQLRFDLLILDTNLVITYANAAALRSSAAAGPLVGRSAITVAPTSALAPAAYLKALQGTRARHAQVEVPGTPTRWFDIEVQPLRGASGITGLAVLSLELENPSIASGTEVAARDLRALIEDTQDIVSVAAPDGRLMYVSSVARDSLGYSRGEITPVSFIFDYVHPEDAPPLRSKFDQLIAGTISGFTCQHRVRQADGSYRWLESSYVPALDNPLINGVVATSRDITQRKEAELRLAQREEISRLQADAVEGMMFEWDLVGGVVHRSRGVLEILGIDPADLPPVVDAWDQRVHPDDLEMTRRQLALALIDGRGYTLTYRIRDARGRYRTLLERAVIQRDANGDPVRAVGCCLDVSEIKRLTQLLGEAQRTARMGGWEYDYATLQFTWTDEMYRIFETARGEFRVTWEAMLDRCTPESRERFDAAWQRLHVDGAPLDLELEITTLRGQRIWVHFIAHLERMLDGEPVRAYGSVQNIQADKLAQIAVANYTGWLKLSLRMADMHAWRWDKASDRIDFAVQDRRWALPKAFPTRSTLVKRMHPEDRAAFAVALDAGFATRADTEVEFRLKGPGGTYRHFTTTARALFDADGQPQGYVGVTKDVTTRHLSEVALRRSEQLLRTTTASTADTLILIDPHLRVRFINRGFAGLAAESIVGRDLSVLLPETVRGSVLHELHQVLATGQPFTYEFQARDPGGKLRHFENRAVRVQDEATGTGMGISISVSDVTERKRLEQEILDVSSRERHAIGRDLHDGLGQELTGVALMLRSLATRFRHQFPEGVAALEEIVGVVNQSIENARSLARGLLPVRTDAGGLPFALRELAARSRELYGFEVTFRAEIWPEITLDETSASHLYRIAQEALTNAARHGRPSTVEILLKVTGTKFLLCIADDGIGMQSTDSAKGLGLKIMSYRAGMIGAKLDVGPNRPRGTRVRVAGEQPARSGALQSGHAIYGGSEYGR